MKAAAPVVLYVAGYGRSGSTILDMMFGLGSSYLSAGELTQIFQLWDVAGNCTCGRTWADCTFWGPVSRRYHAELPDITVAEAARLTRKLESATGVLNTGKKEREDYGKAWSTILQIIAEQAHAPVIVDSSKSAVRGSAVRPLLLDRLAGADIRMLHLVRDPRAVTWSALKGSNQQLEAGYKVRVRGAAPRAVAGWVSANMVATLHSRAEGIRYTRIRYEDLVADPISQLEHVSSALDLDTEEIGLRLGNGSAIPSGHGIAGNRLRREGAQKLRVDNEWRVQLPSGARALSWLAWPIARRYGYRVFQK